MFRYFKKFMIPFTIALLLTVATNGLLVGSSVIEQKLIDGVSALDADVVKGYVPLFIGIRAFVGVLYMLSMMSRDVFGDKLMCHMRHQVFSGVMRRQRRDFTGVSSADYISALTNDLHTLRQGYVGVLFVSIMSAAAVVVSLVLMVYYQPLLALVAVVFAVVMIAAPVLLGEKIAMMQKQRSQSLAKWTMMITDFFAGFEVICSFGMKRHVDEKFQECTESLKKSEYLADGWGDVSHGIAQVLSAIAQSGILGISCFLVLRGEMSLGALAVYASLNGNFCGNLSNLYQTIPIIKGMKPIVERINGFVDYEEGKVGIETYCDSMVNPTGSQAPTLETALELKELTFGYEENEPILKNLNMKLEAGKKVALVGESGCGKTTLIRLLSGDYKDYQGSICFDGREIRGFDESQLCQMISVIHQEVFLFDDTIRNNICLYEEFSEEQLERVLEQSGVYKFLNMFPEGLEYQVGQRGERLSGGQRQRIAIARALIRNTKFLILDEGTSALDVETAEDIERELLQMKNLTMLTITHHLNRGECYDEVLELKHGNVRRTDFTTGNIGC